MADLDIRAQLSARAQQRPPPCSAVTFIQRHNSYSKPVWLECDDGVIYVVKGQHAGRSIFNDHALGILGAYLGAPVPRVSVVIIPPELIQSQPELAGIAPGPAHGSEWIRKASDKQWLAYTDKAYNRSRFAHLAIMYGWLCAGDRQLIYSNQEPYLVHSVDHGHFLPGGPNWTAQMLQNSPPVGLYEEITQACGLTDADIQAAANALRSLSPEEIVTAVAAPPDEWGVSTDERVALAEFLIDRRAALLKACSPESGGYR